MAFLNNCTLIINASYLRTRVVALNGVISIDPFPLFPGGLTGFEIPPQRLDLTPYNFVQIYLHPALKITLIFDSRDQKVEFINKLNLAEENISSDESASASSSNPSTDPTVDSGYDNTQ